MEKQVDVIIPAYKPGEEFKTVIQNLMKQSVKPHRIYILQTLEEGEDPMTSSDERILVEPIQKKDFDHGKTRDYGIRLSDADYVLLMTQDAIPADDNLIAGLLDSFNDSQVGVSYARQLPRKDAGVIETLTRGYNYPAESKKKTKADLEKLGIKTYFCSDVCAMYDRALYEKLGGFVYPTIFNEDMIMASKIVQAGHAVFYCADARVIHSHTYTCRQQFVRNFDLGVSQKQYSEVFASISSEKEGAGFAKKTIFALWKSGHFVSSIYFVIQCVFRLAGYKMGLRYEKLSRKTILKCTMNKGYWKEEKTACDK